MDDTGSVQRLDAIRSDLARLRARRIPVPWRKIAERYPGVPAGTLCAIFKGREPKKHSVRRALGLPDLAPAPVCPDCGQVHVSGTCTATRPRGADGLAPVTVWARRVRAGAVVLGRSRRCKRARCGVHFVGAAKQRYCSERCAGMAAKARRKRTTRQRVRRKARR